MDEHVQLHIKQSPRNSKILSNHGFLSGVLTQVIQVFCHCNKATYWYRCRIFT